jgi:hypothetical protein
MDKKYQIARGKRIRSYGITLAEYDRLFNDQNGVCAICQKTNGEIALCIDHNHATNEVRGLLCNLCNRGIGLFNDDEKLLIKAAIYVKRGVPFYLKGSIKTHWSFGFKNRARVWNGVVINDNPDFSIESQIKLAEYLKNANV